eukprot:5404055-Pleurochrysis_carterae.AAC.1
MSPRARESGKWRRLPSDVRACSKRCARVGACASSGVGAQADADGGRCAQGVCARASGGDVLVARLRGGGGARVRAARYARVGGEVQLVGRLAANACWVFLRSG